MSEEKATMQEKNPDLSTYEKILEYVKHQVAELYRGLPTVVKMCVAEGAIAPQKAHGDDACFDLYAYVDTVIPPGGQVLVKTGISICLPEGYEAQIRPRSGLALKHNIGMTNSPGTIDSGYRGDVGVILRNFGTEEFVIKRHDRIAQMAICKLPFVVLDVVNELPESKRSTGGFGSTGTHILKKEI